MEKKDERLVSEIKLKYLKIQLKKEGVKEPKREDIMRILKVSYPQAYNYLKALKEENKDG